MQATERAIRKFPEAAGFFDWLRMRFERSIEQCPPEKGADGEKLVQVARSVAISGGRIIVPRTEECGHCHGAQVFWPADACECPYCHGTGRRRVMHHGAELLTTCDACFGSGREGASVCQSCQTVYDRQILAEPMTIIIPPGFSGFSTLVAPGLGCPGRYGGQPGDLRILLKAER